MRWSILQPPDECARISIPPPSKQWKVQVQRIFLYALAADNDSPTQDTQSTKQASLPTTAGSLGPCVSLMQRRVVDVPGNRILPQKVASPLLQEVRVALRDLKNPVHGFRVRARSSSSSLMCGSRSYRPDPYNLT
jgi:hypothetical protein